MLTIGLLSMMLAAGVPVSVLFSGSTTSVEGAAPKLHIIIAPMQTCIAMSPLLLCSLGACCPDARVVLPNSK
jgi:hypothetical protein